MTSESKFGTIIGVIIVIGLVLLSIFALTEGFNSSDDDSSSSSMSSSMMQSSAMEESSEEAALVLDESKTLVENASTIPEVSTVFAAINAAGLGDALSAEGPFTVFLPSNDAFEKLPEGTVPTLLEPENKEQLSGLLQYHVVPGMATSEDLVDGQVLETLAGRTLTVEKGEGFVKLIGDQDGIMAMVSLPDLKASNGVVHVIDTVLTI